MDTQKDEAVKPLGEKAKCKAPDCRAVIYWAPNKRGTLAPFDPDGKSHFSTCKDLTFFSARKKQRKAAELARLTADDSWGNHA